MPTKISDLIVPQVWTPYITARIRDNSPLFKSGIAVVDKRIDDLAKGSGKLFSMPFFKGLSGGSVVGSDDETSKIVPGKITSGKDQSVKHFRNGAFSTMDLAGSLAGADPAKEIADQVADWWALDDTVRLVKTLTGVFADNMANDSSDMVITIGNDSVSAITAAEKISANAVIAAKQTMGDQSNQLVAIAMHSALYAELQRQNLIAFIPNSIADIGFGTYLGLSVIVSDYCPALMGTNRMMYTTYLFGKGAIGIGEGSPKIPVAITRDELAGQGSGMETLVTRREFIMHPMGIKFTASSVVGESPTDTELATTTNWDRVYDRKLIRLAAIRSNG